MYYYPDGTTSLRKPQDGDRYTSLTGPQGQPSTEYIFKDGRWGYHKPIYLYPDGYYYPKQPIHGDHYMLCDPHNIPISDWEWDENRKQWINVSSGVANMGNTKTFVMPTLIPVEYLRGDFKFDLKLLVPKCECGSEKAGSNRHSTWCEKYEHQS
jgi:hypothetical protein